MLNKHMEVEGLFRKAGSLARQREFKASFYAVFRVR